MKEEERLYMVTNTWLKELSNSQMRILEILEAKGRKVDEEDLGDYVTEETARKLFGRKTTWLWQMRKSGRLPYSKVGNKVYYMRSELIDLIKNGKKYFK